MCSPAIVFLRAKYANAAVVHTLLRTPDISYNIDLEFTNHEQTFFIF